MSEVIRVPGGARGPAARNLRALLQRAVTLDDACLVRLKPRPGSGLVDCWVTTPFGPLGVRAIAADPSSADLVAPARTILEALAAADPGADPVELRIGSSAVSSWPGALPPADGYTLVDRVPATILRDLEAKGRAVTEAESGPAGPPASLLDQEVLQVSGGAAEPEGSAAAVTMREVFAACALGFIPAEPTDGEPVRVAVRGRHVRLDARFGSVVASAGLGALPL